MRIIQMFRCVYFLALLIQCSPSVAQNLTSQSSFEVASVRPTPSENRSARMNCTGGPSTADPGRLNCTNAPLKMLICIAYQVQYYQVIGPGWMDTDGYDIAANVPVGTTPEQYRLMLQNLLADRLELALHHETKEALTYSLVAASRGSKLRPSTNTPVQPGLNVRTEGTQVHVTAIGQSLSNLAGFLSTKLGVESPVRNATGLAGKYDFNLDFTYPPAEANGDIISVSLFTALETQLGLKLVAKKSSVDVLVVDRTKRKPTEN